MVTAVRQRVWVEVGGRVAVQSSELSEGEQADVIVMVDRSNPTDLGERLKALQQLRQSLDLSPSLAAQWEEAVRTERAAWRSPPAQP
jgi:hypothetical protein